MGGGGDGQKNKYGKRDKLKTIEGGRGALISSILATGDFCHLLITFVNSLDPDQDHNV